METWYMDTSAAVKLLVREDESPALIEAINTRAPLLCSSNLLITELSRAQQRTSSIRAAAVRNVLLRLRLIDVNRTVFEHAASFQERISVPSMPFTSLPRCLADAPRW